MKTTIKIIGSTVVVLGIFAGVIATINYFMPSTREVREFNQKFKTIRFGDQEAKALSVLGKPDAKEKYFRIGQKTGFEDAYKRANSSDSIYFLFWFKGVDIVFTIGINKKGQVSVKESGGT